MSVPPDPARAVRRWVERAEQDLRNAEHTLMLREDCPLDTVCFHAQQCAEKYLKALLTHRSVDFPRTHNLEIQAGLLPDGPRLGVELVELAALTRFAIEGRYPGDWEAATRGEADSCVATAHRVRDAVRALLAPDLLGP